MVALRLRFAALALLRTRQLLEIAVKLLGLPADLDCLHHHFPVQICSQVLDNHAVNTAVYGNQLEEFDPEGHLLHPHLAPRFQPPAGGSSVSNAWYPVSLLRLTNRLLFKVVKKVQPAR